MMKLHLRFSPVGIIPLLCLFLTATGAFTADDAELKAVKAAIQKFEKDRQEAPRKDKDDFDQANLAPVLIAIEAYISQPVAKALNAKLSFEAQYKERPEETKTVTRKEKSDPNVKKMGDGKIVDTRTRKGAKILENYTISGGDVNSLHRMQQIGFSMNHALKESHLLGQKIIRTSAPLKNMHDLIVEVPQFAEEYLALNKGPVTRHENRLAAVEGKREELLKMYKEYTEQMSLLRNAKILTGGESAKTESSKSK